MRLVSSDRLRVALDVGPWTAMRQWSGVEPSSGDLEIVLDIDVGYMDIRDETRRGTLLELWPDFTRSPMFQLIMNLIAEGWQVRHDSIVESTGWERTRDRMFGDLSRTALS